MPVLHLRTEVQELAYNKFPGTWNATPAKSIVPRCWDYHVLRINPVARVYTAYGTEEDRRQDRIYHSPLKPPELQSWSALALKRIASL